MYLAVNASCGLGISRFTYGRLLAANPLPAIRRARERTQHTERERERETEREGERKDGGREGGGVRGRRERGSL